jgi:cobalt-zinc-cadmium efflux system membrane fusion protein
MKYINIVINIYAALLLSSCGNVNPRAEKIESTVIETMSVTLTPEQLRNADLQISAPRIEQVAGRLQVNGVIELAPQNIHTISVPLGGYVRSNRAITGMSVQKGVVLAVVEDLAYIQLQQDYLTAKSKVEFLTADYSRQKELYNTQSNSQRTFQESKAAYDEQKILLRSLEEKLKLIGINPERLNEQNISRAITITAPVSGYISKVNVNPGKYVNSSDVLFELINPTGHYLKLGVFENDAKRLSIGQPVTYTTTAMAGHKQQARISLINRNLDEDRTVEVRCTLQDAPAGIIPGMFVNAEIATNNRTVTVLPDEGVVAWQGKSYVFVQHADNTFQMEDVEVGQQANGFIELKTRITKPCVTKNAYRLLGMLKNRSED